MLERPVSGIVLAGGSSTRMGFNKALARLGPEVRLIDAVVAVVGRLSPDIIVVANESIDFPRARPRVVGDVYPGMGSLGGLYSGLMAARFEHSIVVGCDMPFLNDTLWQHLLSLPRDCDALVPRVGGYDEPLHALYSKGCLQPIRNHLERGMNRVVGFLGEVKVCYVFEADVNPFDPEHRSFLNVNTPEELDKARAIWAREFAAEFNNSPKQ